MAETIRVGRKLVIGATCGLLVAAVLLRIAAWADRIDFGMFFFAILSCTATGGFVAVGGSRHLVPLAHVLFTPRPADRPLKPWQFSIRRMLVATTALAVVLGFFGPNVGYGRSVVWFLSAVLVASIVVPHMGRITVGGFAIFACAILAMMIHDLIWPPLGRSPADGRTALVGTPLLVTAAVCLRVYGRLNTWHLLGSLIVFETFLLLLIVSIAGFDWAMVDFEVRFVLSWFCVQRWYIAVPWLLGTALGGTIVRRARNVQPTPENSSP